MFQKTAHLRSPRFLIKGIGMRLFSRRF